MKFRDFHREQLTFDAEHHAYTWDGVSLVSSTQLIDKYTRPFNAERESVQYAKRHGRDAEEVRVEWEEKGAHARVLGTVVHEACERMVRMMDSRRPPYPEWADPAFLRYIEAAHCILCDHPELGSRVGYCLPELRVASPHYGVAGTIDLLCNLDNRVTILDWKTSEKLEATSSVKMHVPLRFPDTNYWHYAVQLTIYKLILQQEYDVGVDRLVIMQLGADGTSARYDMPNCDEEVSDMLENYKKKSGICD